MKKYRLSISIFGAVSGKTSGFTVIEAIVAIAILSLTIMAFSGLFIQSYAGINSAGNKSKAAYDAQADVEQRMAEQNANSSQNFSINFGNGAVINIKGGVVSSTKTKNGQSSSMDSFLALIPTMTLKPYLYNSDPDGSHPENREYIDVYEGYSEPQPLEITGDETNFTGGGTSQLIIKDNSDNPYIGSTLTVNSKTRAAVSLKAGLPSSGSPYLVTIKTGTESVSAKLVIRQPIKYVAGGGNALMASSTDTASWVVDNWGTQVSVNGVAYNSGKFVAVGDSGQTPASKGKIMYSTDGFLWTSIDIKDPETIEANFRGVAFGNGMYVGVGTGGVVYTKIDDIAHRAGQVLTINGNNRPNLNAVVWGQDKFVAAGDGCTIARSSTDGTAWTASAIAISGLQAGLLPDLNAIAYGTINGQGWYVAAGDNGVLAFSKDAENWIIGTAAGSGGTDAIPAVDFNSVAYGDYRFVVAGSNQADNTSAIISIQTIEEVLDQANNNTVTGIKTTGNIFSGLFPVKSVTWGQNRYWAIQGGNTVNALLYSQDAINWYSAGSMGTAAGMNALCVR